MVVNYTAMARAPSACTCAYVHADQIGQKNFEKNYNDNNEFTVHTKELTSIVAFYTTNNHIDYYNTHNSNKRNDEHQSG